MRSYQFWILLLASIFVSGAMLKQASLGWAVRSEQRQLVDNEEISQSDSAYQTGWRQLAVHIYYGSKQDPELTNVLKKEKVFIGNTPPPAPAAPATSSKNPAPPAPTFHPAGQ